MSNHIQKRIEGLEKRLGRPQEEMNPDAMRRMNEIAKDLRAGANPITEEEAQGRRKQFEGISDPEERMWVIMEDLKAQGKRGIEVSHLRA